MVPPYPHADVGGIYPTSGAAVAMSAAPREGEGGGGGALHGSMVA